MNVLFLYLSTFLPSNPKILQALSMPSKGKNMEKSERRGEERKRKAKVKIQLSHFWPQNFAFGVCLNFWSCQVLTYNWHFGQLICQTIFHYRQCFLKSRIYNSANFIKTSKIGSILNDSCIFSQGFMHQNRQSYDTKFITVQIVPAINNRPPLKGVISQRLGMNFIKTAMLLYLLSFWKANFFPH